MSYFSSLFLLEPTAFDGFFSEAGRSVFIYLEFGTETALTSILFHAAVGDASPQLSEYLFLNQRNFKEVFYICLSAKKEP